MKNPRLAFIFGWTLLAACLWGAVVPSALGQTSSTSEAIALADLQENLSYIFPSASYLSVLRYHSNWRQVERKYLTEASGIEVTYEATFDSAPDQDDELPTINAYIIYKSSQEAAESQFQTWANSAYFSDGTWIKRSSGTDYFTYYTASSNQNDVLKNRVLEEGSLHLISYYKNLLIVVNFYRTSGEYLKNNVSAYITYLQNYEETLSVLSELVVYIEEALKFYTGTVFSVEGPTTYDYYATSAEYSQKISDQMEIPRNGTVSFDVYLNDGSEVGNILSMSGVGSSITGAFNVGINENAVLQFSFYDPYTDSDCDDASGWHHLYTDDSLDLYEWQTITLGFGAGEQLTLSVDGVEVDTCAVSTARVSSSVYIGDYPSDSVQESFVGYLKDFAVTYSVDSSGVRLDDQGEELIFADVSASHMYAEAIAYLKEEGIIGGYEDGTFRPDQEVNRVEILKMLLLGFGYEVAPDFSTPAFSDVQAGAWYLPYLNEAVELGIVQGHSDGTYGPASSLNRVEFLKILTKAYGINLNDYPITGLYADTDENAWYAAYVQYSKDNDLMDTDASGNFNPANTVARGEVAETIYRLVEG